MIKNNNFLIKNLKNVFLIGESPAFAKLIEINKSLGLDTFVITSSHQSKLINKNKIKYKIFDKLDNNFKIFIKKNTKISDTLFISIGSRLLFNQTIIENFFLNNLVNFHLTRLPLDGGGADVSWRIMREDRIDCQLVHLIDQSIDGGPILDYSTSVIPRNLVLPAEIKQNTLEKFFSFYENFLKKILNKVSLKPNFQQAYLGRYNPRIVNEIDSFINWDLDSYDLLNFINAFEDPYQGASTFLNNGNFGKLNIKKVQLHGGDSSNHPFMSGIVSRHDKNWLIVSTRSKHMLIIEKVLDKNGTDIIKKIKVGDRFYTPQTRLEKSKFKKHIFNSRGLNKTK
jgi:methionyl-tRNA formyltransferase